MARPIKFDYKCRICNEDTHVTNTRYFEDNVCIRRHLCEKCSIMYVVEYKNGLQHERLAYRKHEVEIIK